MITDCVNVDLHDSQALIQIINANTTYCAWPRAGGKTGGGIGPRFLHLSEVMPRSQVLLFTDTYERLDTRIVPTFIGFLSDKLGLIEGADFVKYKRPPDNWEKSLIPLDKFERVISFSSGMAICLVSLHSEGSANAFNAQAAIGDEIKFCDESKINTEVLPALRGAESHFGHLPEYLSVWMFTDKFGPKVKWFLKKKEKVNQPAVEIVYTLQMEIFRLQNENAKLHGKKIIELQKKTDAIRKHLVYFSDMKPYENLKAVGEFYFKMQRRVCRSQYEFEVAILNKDPDKVENCFYPTFTAENKYKGVQDYDAHKPFFCAMDYNFRICPWPVAQIGKLPGQTYSTINVIDYLYELYPKGIEDTINAFCKKYEKHNNKTVHYIFDKTAINRNPIKITFKEVVIKTFIANGWKVIPHYTMDPPDHEVKYENIKKWLINTTEYAVRVNEVTCADLIKSVEQSPAIMERGVTKKDKKTEKDLNFPAEESTHGSDAFDQLLWGLFEFDIKNFNPMPGVPILTR
jgi:FtsZ-binding cell division protein ZapB